MGTENHDYHVPAEGATGWDDPLNDNFERLEAATEIRDVEDNLTDYTPEEGARFLAVDTEAEFVGTGSDWRGVQASGQTPNYRGINGWVRYLEPGDDIQQAIDELAAPNDRGVQGGLIKLAPGIYEPPTTLWLKTGVTLEGAHRFGPGAGAAGTAVQGTVITTANMTEEPTYRHGSPDGHGPEAHPSIPLVASYRPSPMELADRDPTEEERLYWGNNIGLRNVTLDAGPKQRWSDEDTYFGVYDACLFSRSKGIRLEHVTTRNFLGYGALFNGCRRVRDIGSRWQGGATDYHGSALTIHTTYPPDPTTYTDTSVWDVDVVGPPPTVDVFTHGIQFVAGGWSNATIRATERVFLGDQADFWNGDAPSVDPAAGTNVVQYNHGRLYMEDYHVEASDAYTRELTGFRSNYQKLMLNGVSTRNTEAACTVGRKPNKITDCTFTDTTVGLQGGPNLLSVNGLIVENAERGVDIGGGHTNTDGTLDRITFRDVSVGISGDDNNAPIVFNYPDFRDCETPLARDYDSVVLQGAVGL